MLSAHLLKVSKKYIYLRYVHVIMCTFYIKRTKAVTKSSFKHMHLCNPNFHQDIEYYHYPHDFKVLYLCQMFVLPTVVCSVSVPMPSM
jgi:hypothetical protein